MHGTRARSLREIYENCVAQRKSRGEDTSFPSLITFLHALEYTAVRPRERNPAARISFMRIQSIIHPVRSFDAPPLSSQPSSFLRALHNSPFSKYTWLASAGKISYQIRGPELSEAAPLRLMEQLWKWEQRWGPTSLQTPRRVTLSPRCPAKGHSAKPRREQEREVVLIESK